MLKGLIGGDIGDLGKACLG